MLTYIEDFYGFLFNETPCCDLIAVFYNANDNNMVIAKSFCFNREKFKIDLCRALNHEQPYVISSICKNDNNILNILKSAEDYANEYDMFFYAQKPSEDFSGLGVFLLYSLINKSDFDANDIINRLYRFHINSLNHKNAILISSRKLVDGEKHQRGNRKKRKTENEPAFRRNKEETLQRILSVINKFYIQKDEISGAAIYKINIMPQPFQIEWNVLELTNSGECSYSRNTKKEFADYSQLVKSNIAEYFYSKDRQSYYHRLPIAFKYADEYFVLLPCCEIFGNNTFSYCILLVSDKPFKYKIISRISEYLSEYFSNYIDIEKSRFLQELQEELLSSFKSASLDLMDIFKNYVNLCFKGLLDLTNSYSITMRLARLKQNTDSLPDGKQQGSDKIVLELFTYVPVLEHNEKPEQFYDVGKKYRNAHSAIFREKDNINKAIYHKNILDPKSGKTEQPDRYHAARDRTASAFCIPLFYKNNPIGTINFESMVENGYDVECDSCNGDVAILKPSSFIFAVKKQIESYLLHLYDSYDRNYFTVLQKRMNEYHNLKNIVFTTEDLNKYKNEFREYFKPQSFSKRTLLHSENEVLSNKLISLMDYYNKSWAKEEEMLGDLAEDIIAPVKKAIKFSFRNFNEDGSDSQMAVLPSQYMDILTITNELLSNFIQNATIYTDTPDYLGFVITKKNSSSLDARFELTISQLSNKKLDERAFYSPIDDGKAIHLGLFIIGSIVRKWGGYIYKNIDKDFSFIRIKIPVIVLEEPC